MHVLVHTQDGKSLPQFMASARSSVASAAPAANSGPDQKMLHTSFLGGFDHSKRIYKLHSSHGSL